MRCLEEDELRVRNIAPTILKRWSAGWRDALISAVAAGLSWLLAHQLFGHVQPVFAAIAAIVCLAPGLPNRGLQAVNMMLGLVVGIAIGEVLLDIPVVYPALRIAVLAFLAMIVAISFGLAPVIAIQAGVSAILVIAMGPITAGPVRLMDAAAGAVVGLVFSQILFTPDPARLIDDAAGRMLRLLAQGFAQEADAIANRDLAKARAALEHFFRARDSLNALRTEIEFARSSIRWSLRGRLAADEVAERMARFDRHSIRLFAAALLFADALASLLKQGEEPPAWLQDRLRRIASTCEMLAEDSAPARTTVALPPLEEPVPASWRACLEHLRGVEDALRAVQQEPDRVRHP